MGIIPYRNYLTIACFCSMYYNSGSRQEYCSSRLHGSSFGCTVDVGVVVVGVAKSWSECATSRERPTVGKQYQPLYTSNGGTTEFIGSIRTLEHKIVPLIVGQGAPST